VGYDAAGPHNCTFTNRDITKDDRTTSDRSTSFDQCGFHLPISTGLQFPIFVCSPWISVVDENNMMTYKHFIFDRHTLTYEAVARDFAAAPYPGTSLDFDKGANSAEVTNDATI
jgi:hypothetical protein